jgi:tryptophan-rich sensory protein
VLYIILGFVFSIAIKNKDIILISLFISNLILNVLWCFFFFYKKDKNTGLIVISLLLINTFLIIMLEKNISQKLLLLPYMLWLCFASFLNYKFTTKIH